MLAVLFAVMWIRASPASPTPAEPPPLDWFTSTDPRFASHPRCAPLRDCPTPGLIGNAEYVFVEAYDNYAHPLARSFFYRLPARLQPVRKIRGPKEALRYASSEKPIDIAPVVIAHFTALGFSPPKAPIVNEHFVENNGSGFHPPKESNWKVFLKSTTPTAYDPVRGIFIPAGLMIHFEVIDGKTIIIIWTV